MIDFKLVRAPTGGLWRVVNRRYQPFDFPPGREPVAWTEPAFARIRGGRWDSSDGSFRTLYCSSTLSGAYGEALRRLAPGPLSEAVLTQRHVGVAACQADARFIDMADPQTHNAIPAEMRLLLSAVIDEGIDRSTMLSSDRRVSRSLASALYEICGRPGLTHVAGLRYESRISPAIECFVVWDADAIDADSINTFSVELAHPSLREALAILGINLTRP